MLHPTHYRSSGAGRKLPCRSKSSRLSPDLRASSSNSQSPMLLTDYVVYISVFEKLIVKLALFTSVSLNTPPHTIIKVRRGLDCFPVLRSLMKHRCYSFHLALKQPMLFPPPIAGGLSMDPGKLEHCTDRTRFSVECELVIDASPSLPSCSRDVIDV